jgi:hypothetical protein
MDDEENQPESDDRPAGGAILPPSLHSMLEPEPDTPDPLPPFYMPQPGAPRAEPMTPPAEPVMPAAEPVMPAAEPMVEAPAPVIPEPAIEPATVQETEPANETPGRRRPSVTTVAIVLLVIAVLVESVFLFRGNAGERNRTAVLDTARRFVVHLTTYEATTLEPWRRDVLALASGKFRDEYDQLTGAEFQKTVRDRQAVSAGTVIRIAIAGVGEDSATVIALVDVSTSNKDLTTPRVERNVIELSMVETSAGWRIVDANVLGILVTR